MKRGVVVARQAVAPAPAAGGGGSRAGPGGPRRLRLTEDVLLLRYKHWFGAQEAGAQARFASRRLGAALGALWERHDAAGAAITTARCVAARRLQSRRRPLSALLPPPGPPAARCMFSDTPC